MQTRLLRLVQPGLSLPAVCPTTEARRTRSFSQCLPCLRGFKPVAYLGQSVLATLAVLALALSACAPAAPAPTAAPARAASMTFPKNADGYADINVEQLAQMLANKDFTFVNVHIPYEGEIAQTDLFIAFDQIDAHLGELPAKDAPIVLYCRSGRMSTDAAKVLAGLGYTNVIEVDGGFTAWKTAGYELLNKP